MKNKKLVIFDFDGVIVESLDLWFEVTKESNPELTKEEYISMSYGSYIEASEKKNITYNHNGLENYRNRLMEIESPRALISFIEKNNDKYTFAIVSSGNELTIKKFLNKEKIESYFIAVLGQETHKSKTAKIINLLGLQNFDNKDSVFITDTLGDVIEAHEASIKSIGVLWGLHDRETLERGRPEVIIENPEELEKVISDILD
ncbi:HAD family hydrolase [Candidatus Nomurabacteria bacterium]|nr:HAD family hydrolase [Candidatus Nomurabacteria bacterium]